MTTKTTTLSLLLLALGAAACGGPSVTSDNGNDGSTGAEPAPRQRLYVSAYSGNDANKGEDAANPMKSLNAALARAEAEGITDVYALSDNELEGIYPEVVFLRSGVNLHGGYCVDTLIHDPVNCPTLISGGTPTLVAVDIDEDTVVRDFRIIGMDAAQTFTADHDYFMVPKLGCMGRGVVDARYAESCTPEVDEFDRPMPQSSVAVVVVASSGVKMAGVEIEAKGGAAGLVGERGADGLAGAQGGNGTSAPQNKADSPGFGGNALATQCEDDLAQGGRGGRGGMFHWTGEWQCYNPLTGTYSTDFKTCKPNYLFKVRDNGTAKNGERGSSASGNADGGRGAPFELREHGASGRDGENGVEGTLGDPGESGGDSYIDPVLLVSQGGTTGYTGAAGHGGAGGGGGAPAIRSHWRKFSVKFSNAETWGVDFLIGSLDGSTTSNTAASSEVKFDQGETTGGGGGAGGNGGCGGIGGSGGQGGGASVGIYSVDSTVIVVDALIKTGHGGDGAVGGIGGAGGAGAPGGDAGNGSTTFAASVAGTYEYSEVEDVDGGLWWLSGEWNVNSSLSASASSGYSESQGGSGGLGGNGGNGGQGGTGGTGAGGWSIGILDVGASNVVAENNVVFDLGAGGDGSVEGLRRESHTIQDLAE